MKNENTKAKANEFEEVSVDEAVVPAEVSDLPGTEVVDDVVDELDEASEVEEELSIYLELQREQFSGRDKRKYWAYFVKGEVYKDTPHKKTVRAGFTPDDIGGYDLLQIMYDLPGEVLIEYKQESMRDDKTRKVTYYDVFTAFIIDPYGNKLEYKVRPTEKSDKALFIMLYNEEKIRLEKERNSKNEENN